MRHHPPKRDHDPAASPGAADDNACAHDTDLPVASGPEQGLRRLLDATHESALLIALDGTILCINQTGATRLGSTPAQLVGENIYRYMPTIRAESRKKRVQRVIDHKTSLTFDDLSNGRNIRYTLYPVCNPEGEVINIAVYGQDITHSLQLQAIELIMNVFDQHLLRGDELGELMNFVCEEVIHLFGLTAAWIGIRHEQGLSIEAGAGLNIVEWEQMKISHCAMPFLPSLLKPTQHGHIKAVKHQYTEFGEGPLCQALQLHGVHSALCIPLQTKGRTDGVFCLYGNRPDSFDAASLVHSLTLLGQRISIAREMAIDQRQLRLLSTALAHAGDGIFITDKDGRIQWSNEAFCRQSGYAFGEIYNKTPSFLRSGHYDATYYRQLWDTIGAGHVWTRETIEHNKAGDEYVVHQTITPIKNDSGHITHYISIHKDITELKAHQQRIAFMAHHDALTGLPNRVLFFDRLSQAILSARRNEETIGLLYLDLDKFKPVNDQYGHDAGDELLRQVSERIKLCMRESDTLSRLGGDEFAAILPNVNHTQAAQRVAEKIIIALNEPFRVHDHLVQIGTSIGIAFYPVNATDPEALIKQADKAMYQAKQQRNTYRVATSPAE